MSSIVVVKLQPINLFDLPLALVLESVTGYKSSKCSIAPNGKIEFTVGEFAKEHTDDPYEKFRNLNWDLSIDKLNDQIISAKQQNEVIVFGSYRQDQIDYLKLKFEGNILTIGSKYTSDMYEILLTLSAKKHIELLVTGKVQPNDTDKTNLKTLTETELIQYYKNTIDTQQLVLRENTDICDYVIPLRDFFNEELIIQHFNNLGISLSISAIDLYKKWIRTNNGL